MYTDRDIQVLKGLEGVRKRPGMYIGGVDRAAMHHLLWNMLDWALADVASYVRVAIDGDAIAIDCDGSAIPVVPHPVERDRTALELVLSVLHAGGYPGARKRSWGHDLPITNALSAGMNVDAWWNGRHYQLGFARGELVAPLRDLGPTERQGMRFTFTPDFTIFERATWDRDAIAMRMRELAALHPRCTLILDHDAVRCPDGIADHARYLAGTRTEPARHAIERDGIAVDVALAWRDHGVPIITEFANTLRLRIGGVDEGVWRAFAEAEPTRFAGVHRAAFREVIEVGLIAVVVVRLQDPQWNPRTKELVNKGGAPLVAETVAAAISGDSALCERLRARFPA